MASPLLSSDPRQLGAYWLAGRIGAGGQGVVYEGYDADGRRVAVKALHADFLTDGYRDMLRKEVQALQQVSSFCTARVLATDFDHVPPYVVSEYVPGPTLQARVEEHGPYDPDELHRLAIGIATALSAIHRAGVIHRDLKPPNVLLGPDGPRVIDFGIARTEEMSRSATGMLKGTPRWMAPELFRGERATPAVDVWAWGAIVLFAATGSPPFEGESLPSLMYQVLNHTPETHTLPEPLRSLVERALSQDPAERPTSDEILKGLLGGTQESPLEAGQQAAAEIAPETAIPPSLAEDCEEAYGSLETNAREAVPRVLLRLVSVRANAEDTVRKATLEELRDEAGEQTLSQMLQVLADAGIIRNDGNAFSLATPALLRAWPRLRDWVEAERDGLDIHHVLADSARFWAENGRKNGDLFQGSALEQAVSWTATERRHLALNTLERDFLDSALAFTRRRGRSRTLVIAALAFLLVLALGATAFSVVQNGTVSRQRDEALAAKVANLATGMRRIDPETAQRLAIAAGSLDLTGVDVRSALVALYHQWERYAYAPPGAYQAERVVSDGTGTLLAYHIGNEVKIADVNARRLRRTLRFSSEIGFIDMAADGKSVVTIETEGGITRVWDTTTGQPRPRQIVITSGQVGLSDHGNYLFWQPAKNDPYNEDARGKSFVLDVGTGKTALELPFEVQSWALSADETLLVTVRDETSVELWNLRTGKNSPLRLYDTKTRVSDVAFSPDRRFFAFTQGKTIGVFDLQAGRLDTLTGVARTEELRFSNIAFSSDGRYLAYDHQVWKTPTGGLSRGPLLRYQIGLCALLRFGPNDKSLRCVDSDHNAIEIDISAAVAPQEVLSNGVLHEAQISADGSVLLIASSEGVALWDPVRKTKLGDLPANDTPSTSLLDHTYRLSGDGKMLLDLRIDDEITIWDVKTRQKKTSWTADQAPGSIVSDRGFLIGSAGFSPDGRTLILLRSKGEGPVLQFWDIASANLLKETKGTPSGELYGGMRSTLPFTRDGRSIMVGSDLGVVEFPSGRITVPATGRPIDRVNALSPDEKLIVSTQSDKILFYDAKTLEREFVLYTSAVGEHAAFSRDRVGSVLATSDGQGRVRLWDVTRRRSFGLPLTGALGRYQNSNAVEALAFSSDGTSVLSVDERGHLRDHLVDPAKIKAALCDRVGSLSREDWATYIPELPYRETC